MPPADLCAPQEVAVGTAASTATGMYLSKFSKMLSDKSSLIDVAHSFTAFSNSFATVSRMLRGIVDYNCLRKIGNIHLFHLLEPATQTRLLGPLLLVGEVGLCAVVGGPHLHRVDELDEVVEEAATA